MKITRLTAFFLLTFILFSFSCKKIKQPEEGAVKATLYDYTGFDGCSWVIKLENDEVLEPANLQDFNFELKENKKIWVKYKLSDSQISICMVGSIVNVEGIWDR